jgi:hypothetical protein
MERLVLLVVIAGLLPFVIGFTRLNPAVPGASPWPRAGSILVCTLAFNLTFFWQELWLVVPKALTPGLVPVLYHNDHDWTGSAPIAELLQGTGALATQASGLASLVALSWRRRWGADARLFVFWMAFQGLYQSLTQFAIGSFIPRNDVGRALAYLGANGIARAALCAASLTAMAAVGLALARRSPPGLAAAEAGGTRDFAWALLATALACVVLSVPFREPRNLVEVAMIPTVVNLVGIGWLVFGTAIARPRAALEGPPGTTLPLVALLALLAFFQIVLRPGIRF